MSKEGFAHQLRIDQIRDGDRHELNADAGDRLAIGRRLGLASIDRFEAHATLTREGPAIRASGRLTAAVTQDCVVTGEPVTGQIDEPFDLHFMPEPDSASGDEEIELGESECDIVFHDGAVIDLGTAIADTLALAVDPYPRSAGAEAALKEAGILTEAEASPFAVLAKLKRSDS